MSASLAAIAAAIPAAVRSGLSAPTCALALVLAAAAPPVGADGDVAGGVAGGDVDGERAGAAGDDVGGTRGGDGGAGGVPVVALDADPALSDTLLDALARRGPDHVPRTEHLFGDGSPVYVNRLIAEDSPYLLQHAHNPVNWYPWGEEAFAAAKAADKPVFLSIGYSTCHWCHVMERESFENLAIAERMNADYIAIKVDREQLPDVDAFYMTGVQMISGGGGWPMSSFLDAEGRPFHGATYFPPDDFARLLARVTELWAVDRGVLIERATEIADAIAASQRLGREAREVGAAELARARARALVDIDPVNGGFGGAPKFPRESSLFFLLERAAREDDEVALAAVDAALEAMAAGGIHDHVGGGFHRYAVDSRWRVPHFEKMLYNQAALARLYAEAHALGGKPAHARVARRTLDYVLREMRSSEGLFHSATDADSEGEEGRYFVWTPEEMERVLGDDDATLAKRLWNVDGSGNFEGHSILRTSGSLAEAALELEMDAAALTARVDAWTAKLLAARATREPPLRDDKVLTAWNAMVITALAEGAETLDEPRWLDAAIVAADALWRTMTTGEGAGLYRARFDGRSSIDGTQADYAYFAEALIALHDRTAERRFIERATVLADTMLERFLDPLDGGFFMGAADVGGAPLATRPKDLYDNAIASGNSVALVVLARLAERTGERRFGRQADALIRAMSGPLAERPDGFHYLLTGVAERVLGESGARRYAARGKVRAEARVDGRRLLVTLDIAPGWHVNARAPLQDYLVPTRLAAGGGIALGEVDFPEPEVRTLAFQREPLALHEGRLKLSAPFPDDALAGHRTLPLELSLQACSDEVCLAPETLALRVPIAALAASAR